MVAVETPLTEPAGPRGPGGPGGPDDPHGPGPGGTPGGPPAPDRARLWAVVLETGLTLIMLGVVVMLFAAYQLWGTGIAEARSQHRLAGDFSRSLAQPAPTTVPKTRPATTTDSDPSTVGTAATTTPAGVGLHSPGPPILEGQAIGWLDIPKIGVHQIFVQGYADRDLEEGPGHYPGTPYPGEAGNAAIAGHRTTFGAPFYNLNELNPGDQIIATTRAGRFVYLVDKVLIVRPNQTEILNQTPDNRLTLTTCHPRFLSYQRLIVVASLQPDTAVAPPAAQVVPSTKGGGSETVTSTPPKGTGTAPTTGTRITVSPALSGTRDAWPPTILWGALFAGLWVLSRVGFYKWRPRWAFVAAGIPLCLVVLWPFFENVARLLPANI